MQGLEVYSTVLWHMKREVEVSYLAQEAMAQDRRSPHAWAIMGNCFSLQKVNTALCSAQWATSLPSNGNTALCSCPMGNFSPFKRNTLPFVTAWWAILTGSLWCELRVLGSLWICFAAVMLVLLHMTAFAFLAFPFVALQTQISILMATAHIPNRNFCARLTILVSGTLSSNHDQHLSSIACRPLLSLLTYKQHLAGKLTASIVLGGV